MSKRLRMVGRQETMEDAPDEDIPLAHRDVPLTLSFVKNLQSIFEIYVLILDKLNVFKK